MNPKTYASIEAALDLLGRQGSYRVLRALQFAKPQGAVEQGATGLLPRTLSLRLKEMGEAGWVEREQFAEVPPRVEYRLTRAAEGLKPVLQSAEAWAERRG